jgi:hypothetical protein
MNRAWFFPGTSVLRLEHLRDFVQDIIDRNWRNAYDDLLYQTDLPLDSRPWPTVLPLLVSMMQRQTEPDWHYQLADHEHKFVPVVTKDGRYLLSFQMVVQGRSIELFQTELVGEREDSAAQFRMLRYAAKYFASKLMLEMRLAMNAHCYQTDHRIALSLTYDLTVCAYVSTHFLRSHWWEMREKGLGECRLVYDARTGVEGPCCRWKNYDFWVPLGLWVLMVDREIDFLWLKRPHYINGSQFDCHESNLLTRSAEVDQSRRWKIKEGKSGDLRLEYKTRGIERWATFGGQSERSRIDAWCHIVSKLPVDHYPLNVVRP